MASTLHRPAGGVGGVGANGAIPEYTIPTIRRVSYVLPNVRRPPRYFALPTLQQASHGPAYVRSGPLLLPHAVSTEDERLANENVEHPPAPAPDLHHTLPISSLALDASTAIQDDEGEFGSPQGILYAGGRDGVVSAWDLGIPMQRKRRRSRAHLSDLDDFDEEATMGLLDDGISGPGRPHARASRTRSDFSASSGRQEWEAIPTGQGYSDNVVRPASFRQCIGSHTEWINDILLCNGNQTVVSASSDGNVNIWNPHDAQSSMVPQILGTHKDYVRALAHAQSANWVASGSFDKTIKLWDIKELRHDPIMTIPEADVRSSIYSLSTNRWGSVMAGGSPERIVRVWDPRSGHQISQLVGHSDTVRKVMMSEDGTHLLSASSDSTIRLWSIGEQRCLHTFTHHTESVWSLFSDHPRLDIFYSGDRSGLVCKVDWERCNEVSDGECVVLARDEASNDTSAKFNADAKSAGIHDIVSFDNSFVWTASASGSIRRWRDVSSRAAREALHPIVAPPPPSRRTLASGDATVAPSPAHRRIALRGTPASATKYGSHPPSVGSFPAANSVGGEVHREEAEPATRVNGLFGIPFDSLVCLAPPNDPYGAAIGLGSISMRVTSRGDPPTLNETDTLLSTASLVSIPSVLRQSHSISTTNDMERGSPLLQQLQQSTPISASSLTSTAVPVIRQNSVVSSALRPASVRSGSLRFAPHDTHHEYTHDAHEGGPQSDDENDGGEGDDAGLEARLAFEERELALDATPLRTEAEDVIRCSPGLIRSTLLNDRRHCLTIDAAGTISLWDIVTGRCLGAYLWKEMLEAAKESGLGDNLLPGEALDVVKERIQGYGAAPIWCTVDTKIGSLSVHLEYPRCFDAEIYLDECEQAFSEVDRDFCAQDDQRVNTGRLLFKSLFAGFAEREVQLRSGTNALLPDGTLAMEGKDAITKFINEEAEPETARTSTSGMRISIAIGPKVPALLSAQSPLSPTNTHHLNDLQRLMIKRQLESTEAETSAVSNDYFSIQRSSDHPSSASTPQAGKGDGPLTPNVISPASPGGNKLMGKLRMSLRRDNAQSKKQGPKTPNGPISPSVGSKGEGSNTLPASSSADGQQEGLSETQQQLNALRSLLAKLGVQSSKTATAAAATSSNGNSLSSSAKEVSARAKIANEMPVINFSPQTALIISESSHDSGGFQVKYRGLVGSTKDDVASLEVQAPHWLLEQIFDVDESASNAFGQRDKDKLTFLLLPWEGQRAATTTTADLSSSVQTSLTDDSTSHRPGNDAMRAVADLSVSQEQIRQMTAMPNGNSRLTATRMLRIKKACAYVADKLFLIEKDANALGGLSSIVASRRGSAAPVEQNVPIVPSSTSTPHDVSLAKALASRTFGFGSKQAAITTTDYQQQPILQLRRPSAISIAASSAAGSDAVPAHVMPPGSVPSDYIEILCKGETLSPNVTLAQVQRYIWKSGAAIKLEYRWRANIEREP